MNDCSIRVVRYCIKIFVQEIFIQILHTKIILQRKKSKLRYNQEKNMGIEKFWYNHDGVNEISIHLERYDQVSCNPYTSICGTVSKYNYSSYRAEN